MTIADNIKTELDSDWIPTIYEEKIRSQRTRSHYLDIPLSENKPVIQHTLLGVELKVGKTRFSCPELSTARYLQAFARLGCAEIAVPYDISKIPGIADELESSWQRMLLLIDKNTKGKASSTKGRIRAKLIRTVRNEIRKIGAGEEKPEFKTSTKQR